MAGLAAAGLITLQIPSTPKSLSTPITNSQFTPSMSTKFPNQRTPIRRVVVFAEGNNGNNGINKDSSNETSNGSANSEEDSKKDQPPVISFSWKDLLNPDPENFVAVGLTGLLAWASVQVLWQLFVISLAIVLAALKYSFIAAILLFILITLL